MVKSNRQEQEDKKGKLYLRLFFGVPMAVGFPIGMATKMSTYGWIESGICGSLGGLCIAFCIAVIGAWSAVSR